MRATGINIRQIVEIATQRAACKQLASIVEQILTCEREVTACNDFSRMGFGDDGLKFRAFQIDVLRPACEVGT